MRISRFGLSLVLVALVPALLSATVIPSGSDLVAVLAEAEEGAVLELESGGAYDLAGELYVTNGVTLRGAGIGLSTITLTKTALRVMTIDTGACVEGVTIVGRNCGTRKKECFGVLVLDGTLRNCRVTGCEASTHELGSAVMLKKATSLVEGCTVDGTSVPGNSYSASYGAVKVDGGILRNCTISGTKSNSSTGGAGLYMTAGLAEGCVVYGNSVTANGPGVYMTGGTLSNSVVTANHGNLWPNRCGGVYLSGTSPKVLDCVIRGNSSPGGRANVDPDLCYSNAKVESNVKRCHLPQAFGEDCCTDEVFFADSANHDYRVCSFTADAAEKKVGSAFTLSAPVSGNWTVSDADGTAVASGAGPSLVFTPQAVGRYTVSFTSSAGTETAVGVLAACHDVCTVSTFAELLEAVGLATDGTVIRLNDGTYEVNADLILTKAITLVGGGWENCTLKRTVKNGHYRVVVLAHPQAEVRGVTCWGNGCSEQGSSSGMLSSSCAAGDGTVVLINRLGGRLIGCRVTKSDAKANYQRGALAVCSADGYANRCLIDGNDMVNQTSSGHYNYGAVFVYDGLVENCLITNNTALFCGGVLVGGNGRLRNCTVTRNAGQKQVGGLQYMTSPGASAQVVNCIFSDNTAPSTDTSAGYPEWMSSDNTAAQNEKAAAITFNCIFGGSAAVPPIGTGSFYLAKPFVNADGGDFHLASGTPSGIEAGLPYESASETDYEGNPRVRGERIDIGCYEADPFLTTVSFAADRFEALVGEPVSFTSEVSNPRSGATYGFTWVFTDHFGAAVTNTEANPVVSLPAGWYTVALSAAETDDPARRIEASTQVDYLHVAATHVYVTSDMSVQSAYPYDDPSRAATNLAEAVGEAIDGVLVELDAGNHLLSGVLKLTRAVTIRGAGRAETTVRLTKGTSRVFVLDNAAAVIEKLGITRGTKGGVEIVNFGGTLRDARVFGNVYSDYYGCGSGISMTTTGLVENVEVFCNTNVSRGSMSSADVGGGGIYAKKGVVQNCLVRDNVSMFGGGIAVCGPAVIRNCTVVGNRAVLSRDNESSWIGGYGGGIYFRGRWKGNGPEPDAASVENCVFFGNSSVQPSLGDYAGMPEWHCYVSGANYDKAFFDRCAFPSTCDPLPDATTTNRLGSLSERAIYIDDPLFRNPAEGLYDPLIASPLHNGGRRGAWTRDDVDIAGHPRVLGHSVDIGAVEGRTAGFTILVR